MKEQPKDNEPQMLLPRRVVAYIHGTGIRALDHLASKLEARPARPAALVGKASADALFLNNLSAAQTPGSSHSDSDPLQTLVERWRSMDERQKEQLIDRVTASVIEVIAASAALPAALKLRKKAVVKGVRRVLKRRKKVAKVLAARSKARARIKKKADGKGVDGKVAKKTPERAKKKKKE
ncbi:MAG: hypothetical protein ABI837_07075 [Acidobacteriota bacterium]